LERYFDYEAYGKDFKMDTVMIKYNNGYLVKYY
jgi:antirestriction protein